MSEENYTVIRIKKNTKHRFLKLVADASLGEKLLHDAFMNELMSEYERSRAISRGFARKPIPHPETTISP